MFLGHYGLALAAKRAAPRTSLGTLVFAAQFLDELWPLLVLAGVERVRIVPGLMAASPLDFVYYPWSHSLLMAAIWSALVGGVYFAVRRYGPGAWVVGLAVLSHWLLDVPVHRPDLPLWPGASAPRVGLGLWNSVSATYAIELGLLALGVLVYVRATRALDRVGSWGLWALVAVLLLSYFGAGGAPPPSERALALTTLAIWLFPLWAYWVDRHREPVTAGVRAVRPASARP